MLRLRDIHKKKIAGLTEYKNLYIESELQSGDKTLCFSYPKKIKYHSDIVEECYIDTKENQYIVKEKNVGSEYTSFKCILNLEDLEGQPFERYASEEQTIDKALALALSGTSWIVGNCNLKKRRTVRISNCSSLDILKEIKKIYRCDLVFNTLTKTIDVYEKLGEDKGAYFIDSLNLKDLSIQGNSYDYYTRIIPVGKDNLRISSINNGKDYVENYQYSNKIKTFYWKDERYTVVENLKEDASAKLEEISKPYRSYSAEILNLAKLNDKYKNILDFKLGDTITLISKENKFRDKQRIVKIIEHPDEHELDTVELANTTLSFEETQTQFQEAADTVDNITTDNGTIDGSTVDNIETKQISDFEANVIKVTNLTSVNAKIHNLEAQNVNITGKLTAVEATIGTLTTNVATIDKLTVTNSAYIADLQASKASITQLEAVNATIQVLEGNVSNFETSLSKKASIEQLNATNAIIVELQAKKANIADLNATNASITELKATKADIKDLQATNANITNLDSDLANIKTLVNGNLSSENIQAGGITSDKLTIANGFITNAMIANLDVSKVNAGDISTSKFRIKSDDGGIEIVGATQQFKDKNNKVRIQMGKDAQGNFNFIIRGEDGTTTLIDHTGIKQKAIADDLIISNMISSDAVGEKQINYNSFVTGFNKDANTNTLKATKIKLDNQNQSLEIAFNSLKTQSDGTKAVTESHSTSINVIQGQINTAINNTQIVKDGQTILLKDDYNRTVQTVNSINSTLGSHTTQINEATGKITSVDTKVNSVQRDLESTKISVSSNSSKITDLNTVTKNQSSDINVLKNQISLKVEQSDIEKSINNIEIGGRNLARNSNKFNVGSYSNGITPSINSNGDLNIIATKGNGNWYTAWYKSAEGIENSFKENDSFTISFIMKSPDTTKIPSIYIKSGMGYYSMKGTLSSDWSTVYYTGTWKKNNGIILHLGFADVIGTIIIKSWKIEKGNKVTDWTPAPEDLDVLTEEKISNAKAEIKITTDAINQTVSSLNSTISTKADNSTVTNVSNKVSSLETNLNSITGKVGNLETSVTTKADKSTTYTKTETDALIKVKTDEINLNLTKNYSSKTDLTNAINNIEIGGRNLLLDSKKERVASQREYLAINITDIAKNNLNKKVTFSGLLRTNGKAGTVRIYSLGKYLINWETTVKSSTTDFIRFELTGQFTYNANGDNGDVCNLSFYGTYGSGIFPVVKEIKVELGTMATDWTPAPEDFEVLTDEKISNAKAEIKITTDAINQTVSNLTTTVSTKADNSTVTSMSNKVASLETSLNGIKGEVSSLETTTTTISSKVNQAQSDATKGINDAKTASDKALSAQNTANTNKNNITTLTTEVTTVKSNIATLDVNLKGITQRVSSTESTTISLNTQMNKLISPHGMPYTKDLIIYGDSDKYYPVYIIGGNQDILRTIKIWRSYSEQAPSDWNTSTHKGSLMLTWQGNFGGWSGADYKEFILENSSQYTQLLADCYISVHCMGYTFFLRGGGTTGAIYHFASDQVIDPKVYYNGSSDLVWSNSNTVYNIYAFAPVSIVNTDRLNSLKIAKESSVNKVDNKVSEIEVNLSSIASRVSSVETTTSNINGQVNNLSTRMNSAEIKLTDSSIINTVSSQFYKKGECDSKYTTQTEFKQTTSNWEFRVTQTGKVNELENSDFGKPNYIWVEEGNTDKVWYEVANWYGGGVPFTTSIRFTDCTNTAAYIRQSFKPKNPKMKTFSVSGYSHYFDVRNTGGDGYPMCHWYVEVRYENNQASYHNFDVREHSGNDAWSLLHWVVNTEVATKGMITKINFYAYKRNTTGDWRTSQLYFHEGDEKLAWRPGGEIYSDTVAIDSKGVTVYHDNGSYSQVGSRGLEHWENGMSKPYHYITDVKIVDARGKCDGTWFTVYLGDYFRGKQCDLAWQMGNIALTYGRCLSGYEVDCRNYNWQAGTVEMSVKVFYKSEWAGGAGYDKDAYAWGKIFIWY